METNKNYNSNLWDNEPLDDIELIEDIDTDNGILVNSRELGLCEVHQIYNIDGGYPELECKTKNGNIITISGPFSKYFCVGDIVSAIDDEADFIVRF